MEYRANVFAHRFFGYFVTSLCIFWVLALIISGAVLLAALLVAVALLSAARISSRRMVLSTDLFRYDGWITSLNIPLTEIQRVVPANYFGYPTDRVHGGNEYCVITTDGKRRWISLLWFAPPACRQFHEQFVAGSHARKVA